MEGATPPTGAPQTEMRVEEERGQEAHHGPPPLSPQRQAAGGGLFTTCTWAASPFILGDVDTEAAVL